MSPVQIDTSAIAPTGSTTPREPPEPSPFAATATATTDTNSSAGHSVRHVQVTRRRGQAAPTPIHSLGVTGAADTTSSSNGKRAVSRCTPSVATSSKAKLPFNSTRLRAAGPFSASPRRFIALPSAAGCWQRSRKPAAMTPKEIQSTAELSSRNATDVLLSKM
jgi:hypothetical protein